MIKAVVFDFWGTLMQQGVRPSPLRQCYNVLAKKMSFASFVLLFEQAFMTKPFENLYEAFTAVCHSFEIPPEKQLLDRLVGMWNKNKLLAKPFPDVMKTLESLSKDYKIGLIANTDNLSVPELVKKYGIDNLVGAVLYSFEEGLLKINHEVFSIIASRLGVNASEALMVGDTIQSDIIPAKKAGFHVVLIDRANNRDFEPKIGSLEHLEEYIKYSS